MHLGVSFVKKLIMYPEDDLLMLSGIQHIAFCPRQWALIHIEQQWAENVLTLEGQHLHERVDDPFESEMLKNKIVIRSMSLVSHQLGLYGRADVVELLPAGESEQKNSVQFAGREGRWLITPIEYKRGKPKKENFDEVQLCAQAMCLEEMNGVEIYHGWLYYGETRHRHEVEFSKVLRDTVVDYCHKMHSLYQDQKTPLAVYKLHCKSCSLIDICMPQQFGEAQLVSEYLSKCFD